MKLLIRTVVTTAFAFSVVACGGAQTGVTTDPEITPADDDTAPCMRSIAETISLDTALHYDDNQSDLTSEQRVAVTALALALIEHGTAVDAVHVIGYARATESDPSELAADRAAQVAIELTNLGVDSSGVGLRPASGYCPPAGGELAPQGCDVVDDAYVAITFEQPGCGR